MKPIKVIHSKDGQIQESEFDFLSQWEAHLAENSAYFEGFTNTVIDQSAQYLKSLNLERSAVMIKACNEAIEEIKIINQSKMPDIVLQILTNPTMGLISQALLLGSPATAKGLMVGLSTELYSEQEKASVIAILDPVINLPLPALPVEPEPTPEPQ